jgi:hypothetical protein
VGFEYCVKYINNEGESERSLKASRLEALPLADPKTGFANLFGSPIAKGHITS